MLVLRVSNFLHELQHQILQVHKEKDCKMQPLSIKNSY
jgi:hypothetical protein